MGTRAGRGLRRVSCRLVRSVLGVATRLGGGPGCVVVALGFSLLGVLWGAEFQSVQELAGRNGQVSWADSDADGRVDLLVTGYFSGLGNRTELWRQTSAAGEPPVFSLSSPALPVSDAAGWALWGDFDGDGDVDLLLADQSREPYQVWLLRNDGGVFTNAGAAFPGGVGVVLRKGDFDRDGDLDVLICGAERYLTAPTFTRLYWNDGVGQFRASGLVLPGVYRGATQWADFDADSDLDVWITGNAQAVDSSAPLSSSWLYRQESDGSLSVVAAGLPGLHGALSDLGDLDGDGDLDLAVSGQLTNGWFYTATVRNDGDLTFTVLTNTLPVMLLGPLALGDGDADGFPDLVFGGWNGETTPPLRGGWFRNDGTGRFLGPQPSPDLGILVAGNAAWADIDADGRLEFAAAVDGNGQPPLTRIWRNLDAPSNAPPTMPSGLRSAIEGGEVRLAWDAAAGVHSERGLTYNLRVGRAPGQGDVMPAHSDPGTGRRLLAELGNCGPRRFARLRLPPGPYAWSVQAIDAAFRGGPFAAEATLLVPPRAPELRVDGVTLGLVGAATVTGAVQPNALETAWWAEVAQAAGGDSTNRLEGSTLTATNVWLPVNAGISGLDLGQTYRLWLVASNAVGVTRSAGTDFTVRNEPPGIAGLSNVTVFPAHPTSLPFTVSDPDGDPDALVLEVAVRRLEIPDVLDGANVVLGGGGTNRTLTLTTHPSVLGRAEVTVWATDPFGGQARTVIVVTAHPFENSQLGLYGSLSPGDLNNDGRWDLYLPWTGRTLLRDALGRFLAAACEAVENDSGNRAVLADLTGDGLLDVVRLSSTSSRPPWACAALRNQGAWGQLETGKVACGWGLLATNVPVGTDGALAAFDSDNDGDLDLLLAPNSGAATWSPGNPSTVGVWENRGGTNLAALPSPFPKLAAPILAVGDYDGDGAADVFMSGVVGNGSRPPEAFLFRNEGGHRFTRVPQTWPGFWFGRAAWGDLDNDGDLDLVVSGSTNVAAGTSFRPATVLYRNDHGVFAPVDAPALARISGDVGLADFDGDGRLDLVLGGTSFSGGPPSNGLRLFRQSALGGFADAFDVANLGILGLAVGDWDDDGDPDLLASVNDQAARFLRNLWNVPNPPPAAPTRLRAEIQDGIVVFRWDPATDPNQPAGHSYNLRVGTAPGRDDVVVSMADPGTGRRRVSALGNAGLGTSWPWRRPRLGTFYWSVQAIDHGLAVSPFAPEQPLTVTDLGPVLLTSGLREATSTSAYLEGEFFPNTTPCSWWFEWGETETYGRTTLPRTIEAPAGAARAQMTVMDLPPGSAFHARLIVSNHVGVTHGPDFTFATSAAAPFGLLSAMLPAVGRSAVAWADFDADNDLDLVEVPLSTNGMPTVFRADGTGWFAPEVLVSTNLRSAAVQWADFDSDGDLDLLLTGSQVRGGSYDATFVNEGGVLRSNRITLPGPPIPLARLADAEWSDFDHDGNADVLMPPDSIPSVRRNAGRGHFPPVVLSPAIFFFNPITWSDVNGDGELDVVDWRPPWANLHLAYAPGLWTNEPTRINGEVRRDSFWRDYNRDGAVDCLLAGSSGSSYPGLMLNNGSGGFTNASSDFSGILGKLQNWGDFDGDGVLDVVTYWGFEVVFWSRQGDAHKPVVRIAPLANRALDNLTFAAADFDQDGRLDFLITGDRLAGGTNHVNHLYRNTQGATNHPPTPPANLTAAVTGNEVRLAWMAASDADQPAGLSYNVRVGTASRSQNILNAWSNPLTGFRRLPQPGNAGLRRELRLQHLYPGTYYWSVQAVDDNLTGSPFAPEATFDVPPEAAPTLTLSPSVANHAVRAVSTLPGWIVFETSHDLSAWQPVQTTYVDAGSPAILTIPAASPDVLFLRASVAPR